jgi:hypothetical protein
MEVSPLWLQAMLLTFVVGFAIMGYLALEAHSEHAPVPGRVVNESGRLIGVARAAPPLLSITGSNGYKLGQEPAVTYRLAGQFVAGRAPAGDCP